MESELSIRVMSYNIAAGHGDLSRIADVIRASGAELVGLQEVDVHWSDRSDFVDQARWLAEALEMEVAFAPIYSLPPLDGDVPQREFGLAMLSRHPILVAENHEITRLSTQSAEPVPTPLPGFQEVAVEFMGRRVSVYNTHLDYRSDPAVRRLQVADMLRLIGEATRPVLLLGDLNAEPHAQELLPLLQRLSDVWPPRADPGFTYPANGPTKRIDYILASEHFETRSVRVLETDASDHLPVLAELMILRSPPRAAQDPGKSRTNLAGPVHVEWNLQRAVGNIGCTDRSTFTLETRHALRCSASRFSRCRWCSFLERRCRCTSSSHGTGSWWRTAWRGIGDSASSTTTPIGKALSTLMPRGSGASRRS